MCDIPAMQGEAGAQGVGTMRKGDKAVTISLGRDFEHELEREGKINRTAWKGGRGLGKERKLGLGRSASQS